MEIRIPPLEYEKTRRDFGHQPNFGDTPAKIDDSIDSDPRYREKGIEWFQLIEKTVDLDCIPKMARHMVSTRSHKTAQKGSSHQDGAWPTESKKMDLSERDKLRKRLKKDDLYLHGVPSIAMRASHTVNQNNVIDMYEKYFDEEDKGVHISEPPSTKTAAVFRDPNDNREANYVSWHPENPGKLAVAYSCLQFQRMPVDMKEISYIWDVHSPNSPELALVPNSPLVSLEYNIRSPEQIVGGSYNGLVSFWDLRKGATPTNVIDKAHHDPVYDIRWIQSRSFNECVTVSTDGRMLWWDVRNLKQGYGDSLILKEDKEKTTYGGMSMAYKTEAGATKYLVGTEQGYVLLVDRKAKKDAESTKTLKLYGKPGAKHHGPIYSIERNPIHYKNFLTVGDWTARVWVEDLKAPIMTTRYDKSWLTAACWSPTRPGVFFTTKDDGTLDVWDIYYKQNEPTFSTKVTDASLCAIKVEKSRGNLLAIGSKDGTCTVLQISAGLYESHADEKKEMGDMFEREMKREKNLENRALARKREEKERAKAQPVAFDPYADEPEPLRKKLEEVERRFFATLKINPDGTPLSAPAESEKAPEAGPAARTEA